MREYHRIFNDIPPFFELRNHDIDALLKKAIKDKKPITDDDVKRLNTGTSPVADL
tara:strand:+ start:2518 stop:2682 length:165 start_codon:yes stop_codon:yes gene_type:complete